jgi:hypothetical protein
MLNETNTKLIASVCMNTSKAYAVRFLPYYQTYLVTIFIRLAQRQGRVWLVFTGVNANGFQVLDRHWF